MIDLSFSSDNSKSTDENKVSLLDNFMKLKASITSISQANKSLKIFNFKMEAFLNSIESFSSEKIYSEDIIKKVEELEESFAKSCVLESSINFDDIKRNKNLKSSSDSSFYNENEDNQRDILKNEKSNFSKKENLIKICKSESFNKSSMALQAITKVIGILYSNPEGVSVNEIIRACGVAKYRVLEVISCLERILKNQNVSLKKEEVTKKGGKIYKLEF